MRTQRGCVSTDKDNWCLRWRESVSNGTDEPKRKLRFKILGPILPEHRRAIDRKTGKMKIPQSIQDMVNDIMAPVKEAPASILTTIGEFVATHYMPDRKKTLKPSTYRGYSNLWERYLRERLSNKVMRDFKRPDCFNLWREITREHSDLSRQTLSNIRFFVSGVFNAALNLGLYSGDNPAQADLPSGLKGRKETKAYTIEEVSRILSLLVSPMAQALVALAWGSGMRRGELAAVRWQDIEPKGDGAGAVIHVRQSSWRGILSQPKTESSADDVHIDAAIVEYLEAYRTFAGDPKEGLIFAGRDGKPISLESFARCHVLPVINRCAECHLERSAHTKHGHAFTRDESLPSWKGWHSFRRGLATFIAANSSGADGVHTASLMLRHAREGVTQAHYVKNTKQDRRAIAAGKVVAISRQREEAAATIGQGLRQTQVN